MSQRPQVKIVKEFNASAETVFDAWLDTEIIGRWMFGPGLRDEEIVALNTNPEVGGTFSFVVHRDGEELDHKGTYREIDRPNRLVFTWGVNEEAGDESVVTIDITPTEDGTRNGSQVGEIQGTHQRGLDTYAGQVERSFGIVCFTISFSCSTPIRKKPRVPLPAINKWKQGSQDKCSAAELRNKVAINNKNSVIYE